ncbi:MAG: CAP domain-containing protein [Actinobacteria bacterium]|nr:CAP domain-containing protein [Actinomycetota bacterium]
MKLRGTLLPTIVFLIAASLLAFPAGGCLGGSVSGTQERNAEDSARLALELAEHVRYVRDNASQLASLIHRYINEERKKRGLRDLQWDQQLAQIAYAHSKDMSDRDYFDHVSPEGEDFSARYRKNGYTLQTRVGDQVYVGGENLFLNNVVASYTYDQLSGEVLSYTFNDLEKLARSTVDGWMDSPGHRENILTPFSREGIGIFVNGEGEVYITENFS